MPGMKVFGVVLQMGMFVWSSERKLRPFILSCRVKAKSIGVLSCGIFAHNIPLMTKGRPPLLRLWRDGSSQAVNAWFCDRIKVMKD